MTEKESLEIALIQWDYIYMHGGTKRTAIFAIDLPKNMVNDCSLCEYVYVSKKETLTGDSCEHCPVSWKNPYKCYNIDPCIDNGSEFSEWYCHKTRKNAKIISDLILKTLNRLYPEENYD